MASLLVVTIVAGLGAGLVSVQSSINRRHAQGIHNRQALYVAEAGLSEAFLALCVGKSGNVGTAAKPAMWGSGVYWVEATQDPEGSILLNSTGLVGGGRRSITAVVRAGSNPVAESGFFGMDGVTIGEGAIVDGCDSTLDNYEDELTPSARVTSNGDITLHGNLVAKDREAAAETFVYGNVSPGVEGVIVSEPGVQISGSTFPLTDEVSAPAIPVPDLPLSGGSVDLSGSSLSDVDLRYEAVQINAGTTLTLKGPLTLVVDTLEVDGTLELDGADGKVEVFVLRDFRFRAGSALETISVLPTQVGIFLGDLGEPSGGAKAIETPEDALVFLPTGTFRGMLFAPFSDLTIPASLRVFGSVGGKTITLAPGARVTFDEAMLNADLGVDTLPQLLSWQVVELPDEDLVSSRLDPLLQLKLQGVEPVQSAQAHAESVVQLEYRDHTNVKRHYTGDISAFDLNDVYVLESVKWQDPVTLEFFGKLKAKHDEDDEDEQ